MYSRADTGPFERLLVEVTGDPDFVQGVAARHPVCGQAVGLECGSSNAIARFRDPPKDIGRELHDADELGGHGSRDRLVELGPDLRRQVALERVRMAARGSKRPSFISSTTFST